MIKSHQRLLKQKEIAYLALNIETTRRESPYLPTVAKKPTLSICRARKSKPRESDSIHSSRNHRLKTPDRTAFGNGNAAYSPGSDDSSNGGRAMTLATGFAPHLATSEGLRAPARKCF